MRFSAASRFAGRWLGLVLCVLLAGCGDSSSEPSAVSAPNAEWPMYGGGIERLFFNSAETKITTATVSQLVPRWRFLTDAVVMASPVVADIQPSGEAPIRTVFVSSWDRTFYALRADDGELQWHFTFKPHPGSAFQQSSTAAIADVDGQRRVYVASGETLYCLDAATGALVWQFDAGTGCTSCDRMTERNEIASSPAVFDGVVYFGMDVNELPLGKGGLYAVDARTGTLRWYFDLESGGTCHPASGDAVRRFDGFHDAASLGLADDFFATREGCTFDRQPDGCGNIWGSPAIDASRRMLYLTSGNCDRPVGTTMATPPFNEAIFALSLEGAPVWRWRPREIDPEDLDFGTPPNLFQTTIAGELRDVVGAGGKDGTYYVLDRDGTNRLTGTVEPYWKMNVVPGGSDGGIIAPAAVGEGRILFSTAIGNDNNDYNNYQRPAAWGLAATDGSVAWSNNRALPSFSPTSAIPGVVFMGSILGGVIAYDSGTGAKLATLSAGGALSSAAVIVDGQLYVGAGTGARESAPESTEYQASLIPSPISAFCLAGTVGCPEAGKCNAGVPCAVGRLKPDGSCATSVQPDGTPCRIGVYQGTCQNAVCTLTGVDCDDQNQCTRDIVTPTGCAYESEPATTPCAVGGHAGTCTQGYCNLG